MFITAKEYNNTYPKAAKIISLTTCMHMLEKVNTSEKQQARESCHIYYPSCDHPIGKGNDTKKSYAESLDNLGTFRIKKVKYKVNCNGTNWCCYPTHKTERNVYGMYTTHLPINHDQWAYKHEKNKATHKKQKAQHAQENGNYDWSYRN